MTRFNKIDAILLLFLLQFLLLLPLYGTSDSVEGLKETNAEFTGSKQVVAVDRKGGGHGGGGGGGHGGGGSSHGGGSKGSSNQVYGGRPYVPVYAGGAMPHHHYYHHQNCSNRGNLGIPVDLPHLVLLMFWIVYLFDVLHS